MLQRVMMKFLHILLTCCYCVEFSLANEPASASVVYLSDMSVCEPAEMMSDQWQPGKWRLIPYQTTSTGGTMLAAASYLDVPEVRLPIAQKG